MSALYTVTAPLIGNPVTSSDQRGPAWLRSLRSFQTGVQQAGPAATAGYSLVGAVGFCGGIGYAVDRWLGTTNGLTIGLLLGVGVGLYLLAKELWRR